MSRIKDPELVKRFLLTHDECVACGKPSSNVHHVVQKGSPHFGDDVTGNLVAICGSGTMRCHGAIHGTPYSVLVGGGLGERRTQEWVARRIGEHIAQHRSDILRYVFEKIGPNAGTEFLRRTYYMTLTPPGPIGHPGAVGPTGVR